MLKKIIFLGSLIIISSKLLSMEKQNESTQTNVALLQQTFFNDMPDEILEVILKESIKTSIDELQLPIGKNDFSNESNARSLAFAQHYSYIIQNLRRINQRCNNTLVNLEFYARYCLILKLNKLSIDQKFNALLCFGRLKRSTFISCILLSFLDLENYNMREIFAKFQLLREALRKQIFSFNYFNSASLNDNLFKIHNFRKLSQELLAILIMIRSKMPLSHGLISRNLDLFDINELYHFHLVKYPKAHKHYDISSLKQLTNAHHYYEYHNLPTKLMRAAFNNDLTLVIRLIEQKNTRYEKLNEMTSIHWALLGSAQEVLEYLLSDEEIKSHDWIWLKHLWNWAIRNCNTSILEYLIELLRNNLPSYEFHQVIGHKVELVKDNNWEKPIKCFNEEKMIFLINTGVPLQKFSFENFSKTESIMINQLFDLRSRADLVNKNLEKLKTDNNIECVTANDIIHACNLTGQRFFLQIPRLAPHRVSMSTSSQSNKNAKFATKTNMSKLEKLLLIAGVSAVSFICYKFFNDKKVSKIEDCLELYS